jgi:hypothetical protein
VSEDDWAAEMISGFALVRRRKSHGQGGIRLVTQTRFIDVVCGAENDRGALADGKFEARLAGRSPARPHAAAQVSGCERAPFVRWLTPGEMIGDPWWRERATTIRIEAANESDAGLCAVCGVYGPPSIGRQSGSKAHRTADRKSAVRWFIKPEYL